MHLIFLDPAGQSLGNRPFSLGENRPKHVSSPENPRNTQSRSGVKTELARPPEGLRPCKSGESQYSAGIPSTLQQPLSRYKLFLLWSTGSPGSPGDCTLRQSRNSLDARPERCDRLLDHESLVRQSRHNSLDNKEHGEAKDRKPPGVGYHDVIPVWQSFILGNIEEELHETREQRRAKVVDVLSSADAVSVLRPEEDVAKLLWMRNAELNQAA